MTETPLPSFQQKTRLISGGRIQIRGPNFDKEPLLHRVSPEWELVDLSDANEKRDVQLLINRQLH